MGRGFRGEQEEGVLGNEHPPMTWSAFEWEAKVMLDFSRHAKKRSGRARRSACGWHPYSDVRV